MNKFFLAFCALMLILFSSCKSDPVKETVTDFYLSYQNLDFEKAKQYCNPLMVQKITLIEKGFTPEKRKTVLKHIRKNRIKVEEIKYDDAQTKATARVSFYKLSDDDENNEETTIIHLEKIQDQWKIADF